MAFGDIRQLTRRLLTQPYLEDPLALELLQCFVLFVLVLEGALAIPMPLPNSLRRPVRRTSSSSSTGQLQRRRCRICNNLDPRDHPSSVYPDDGTKGSKAILNLVIDALSLARTKDVSNRGCRFCNVLVQISDAFFENWRGSRSKLNVEIKQQGTIKVSLDGDRWKGELVEIYAGSCM